jgi:hypothetical protein
MHHLHAIVVFEYLIRSACSLHLDQTQRVVPQVSRETPPPTSHHDVSRETTQHVRERPLPPHATNDRLGALALCPLLSRSVSICEDYHVICCDFKRNRVAYGRSTRGVPDFKNINHRLVLIAALNREPTSLAEEHAPYDPAPNTAA